ncbi:MAG: hypothetical protein Q4G60_10550 [bacterium]|nr:hypothetical protein [bacterium]
MSKSVFYQDDGQCYLCNLYGIDTYHTDLEEHHIFGGTANRKKSEKYGLKVKLCRAHHTGDYQGYKEAVHFNGENDRVLKKIGQKKFEMTHSREKFIKEFGKSWL